MDTMGTLTRRIPHYSRTRYRVPASLAAVFMSTNSAAVGRVTNISVTGCLIHCPMKLEAGSQVAIRLRVADQRESLNIESAIVRWTDGTRHGLEFHNLSALSQATTLCVSVRPGHHVYPGNGRTRITLHGTPSIWLPVRSNLSRILKERRRPDLFQIHHLL